MNAEAHHMPDLTPRDEERPQLLSVVCPVYNEESNVAAFFKRVSKVMRKHAQSFEVVFVNDGSCDGSLRVLKALHERHENIAIVDFSRNFGKEVAITAGLDHARGDAVVIMDGDLQHPPESIPDFIFGWREGYDVVYGVRNNREGESWLRRSTAEVFYKIMQRIGEVEIPANAGDFRLLSRKAVDAVTTLREHHRFMKGVFAWVGFPTKAVPFDVEQRHSGTTKWNYWKLWNFSIEGVTAHTLAPLRVSTYLGLVVAALSFLYGFYIIVKAAIIGDPAPGFPTIATLVLFLGGVQLIVLGVIGEYLGRIFNETKGRPLYITNAVVPAREIVATDTDMNARNYRDGSAA